MNDNHVWIQPVRKHFYLHIGHGIFIEMNFQIQDGEMQLSARALFAGFRVKNYNGAGCYNPFKVR